MKIFRLLLIATIGLTLSACDNSQEEWNPGNNGGNNGGNNNQPPVAEVSYAQRAMDTFDAIVRCYRVTSGATKDFFNENYPKGAGDLPASFLWPYDGLVAGASTLHRLGYDVGYAEMVDRFQAYYRPSAVLSVGGFGSSTDGRNGGGDRFFDDNAIIGIELVEAYHLLKDSKYLDWCAQIVRFYQAGIDDTMGRALWWCENNINQPGNDSSNKPACANGFATWFLMKYYEVCPESEKAEVLDLAKTLYKWLYDNLRDPEDNLYWNSKGADGTINTTKWTYNSGAMIAGGVLLHKATGESHYLNEAKATAKSSYDYYVRSRNGIPLCYPTNDPWFTIQLIKSYIVLEPYDKAFTKKCMEVFIANLDNAWEKGRMNNGLFYEDWTGVKINPDRDKSLLMQAAALESLGTVAIYKNEKPNE
ncbi:MAG: glycosyltransferase [Bacteroidales bacterium]|nr:glycosyltransferase [Bacteroidales bacterium]